MAPFFFSNSNVHADCYHCNDLSKRHLGKPPSLATRVKRKFKPSETTRARFTSVKNHVKAFKFQLVKPVEDGPTGTRLVRMPSKYAKFYPQYNDRVRENHEEVDRNRAQHYAKHDRSQDLKLERMETKRNELDKKITRQAAQMRYERANRAPADIFQQLESQLTSLEDASFPAFPHYPGPGVGDDGDASSFRRGSPFSRSALPVSSRGMSSKLMPDDENARLDGPLTDSNQEPCETSDSDAVMKDVTEVLTAEEASDDSNDRSSQHFGEDKSGAEGEEDGEDQGGSRYEGEDKGRGSDEEICRGGNDGEDVCTAEQPNEDPSVDISGDEYEDFVVDEETAYRRRRSQLLEDREANRVRDGRKATAATRAAQQALRDAGIAIRDFEPGSDPKNVPLFAKKQIQEIQDRRRKTFDAWTARELSKTRAILETEFPGRRERRRERRAQQAADDARDAHPLR